MDLFENIGVVNFLSFIKLLRCGIRCERFVVSSIDSVENRKKNSANYPIAVYGYL
jgi:hypothetical protein